MRALFLALLILAWSGPTQSTGAAQSTLDLAERAQVVEVIDGDTLLLDDGRPVRLVGIQSPKLPLGRAGFEAWPLAEEAKAALSELTLGREVASAMGGAKTTATAALWPTSICSMGPARRASGSKARCLRLGWSGSIPSPTTERWSPRC